MWVPFLTGRLRVTTGEVGAGARWCADVEGAFFVNVKGRFNGARAGPTASGSRDSFLGQGPETVGIVG